MTRVDKKRAQQLGDTPPDQFRQQLHELADWIADYRETIGDGRVAPEVRPGEIVAALPQQPPELGESFEQIFTDVKELIIPNVLHWGHPQFTAYFGATSTAPGVLAEMIAAALNVNAMTWKTSPAATELETVVLDWLRQWLRLPEEFRGVVYDTASISTMHALAAAREGAAQSVRDRGIAGRPDVPMFRIYVSDQAHSSIDKAAIALGLGEQNVVRIESDAQFRIRIDNLQSAIERDKRENFRPLAVVATVGTTSTASVDSVHGIAAICREHKLWLHIDAAYGGGLALLPECEWITAGWSDADSIVVNPHKMLFVPFDFSALYVRDIDRLRRVFALVPEYLRGDAEG
ncbi:MAG: PLP-dependent decarboxylase, partial [Verrucomicrobiaceae bacterium]|nr:PLP-dependent decarboxylase [Verrucomicrobiaceae bacterium]